MASPFPDLGPKYRLERRLSRGELGDLFLARHEGPAGFSRPVVVKTLRSDVAHAPEDVKRFLAEAQVASLLSHPNIVRLYDFGEAAGTHFLVLEHLDGEPLARLLTEAEHAGRKLTPGFIVAVGAQVCAGLACAHACLDAKGSFLGLIHPGLRPSNLIACADGRVRILGFGVDPRTAASAYAQQGPEDSAASYLSPEQCGAGSVDARSDVFSLGVVLWELVTGRRLTGGNTPAERARWVREVPAPPLRTMEPLCPKELAAIIERALLIDPTRRFPGASEMGRALEALLVQFGANSEDEVRTELVRKDIVETAAPVGEDPKQDGPGWLTGNSYAAAERQATGLPPTPEVLPELGAAEWLAARPRPLLIDDPVQEPPLRARSRRPLLVAGFVAAVALAAVGALALRPARVEAIKPPARWGVSSDPPGASVWLGDRLIGRTPYQGLDTGLDGGGVLTIELEGFRPATAVIRGGEPVWVFVDLVPVQVHTRPPTPGAAPRPERRELAPGEMYFKATFVDSPSKPDAQTERPP